eukprot:scaffold13660_cov144-Isochrysis_galbana.AAC.1
MSRKKERRESVYCITPRVCALGRPPNTLKAAVGRRALDPLVEGSRRERKQGITACEDPLLLTASKGRGRGSRRLAPRGSQT